MISNNENEKIQYTNEPIGRIKIVDDFLPSPVQLIHQKDALKSTLFHRPDRSDSTNE